MAWLNDLSAALGLPIGAVTLATSLVLAAEKAEKEARPEALRDIAEALKNPRWTEAFRPNLQIRRVFESTFSGRHLSWKCLRRSMAASVIFILALIGFFITRTGRNPFEQLTTFYPGVWYKVFLIVLFFLLTFSCAFIALRPYPSVSGSTKCCGLQGGFVIEQITNIAAFGARDDRFSPLPD